MLEGYGGGRSPSVPEARENFFLTFYEIGKQITTESTERYGGFIFHSFNNLNLQLQLFLTGMEDLFFHSFNNPSLLAGVPLLKRGRTPRLTAASHPSIRGGSNTPSDFV